MAKKKRQKPPETEAQKRKRFSRMAKKRSRVLGKRKRRKIAAMGAKAMYERLTPEERSERASNAAKARWAKERAEKKSDEKPLDS